MVGSLLLGRWLPAELVAGGLGEVAEPGAWPRSTPLVHRRVDDGVRERPGGLLNEADLAVGLAGLQLVHAGR